MDVEDLRSHPLFLPLPRPDEVFATTPADFALFRQSTWQWDALHAGRLTTSRAAACLGLYEEGSAKVLGVPRSLSGHGKALHAWQFLCEPAPADWAFLNADHKESAKKAPERQPTVWHAAPAVAGSSSSSNGSSSNSSSSISSSSRMPAYAYRPRGPAPPRRGYTSASHARMAWGSAQEATAVLAALNYFAQTQQDPQQLQEGKEGLGPSTVGEVGMYALEALPYPMMPLRPQHAATLQRWLDEGSLPPVGASPDGIIRHADGTVEVLEVKCHSPFVDAAQMRNRGEGNGEKGALAISDRGPASTVAAWHVPQLMLHILCAGPACTGAVLVSLSATKGATLFRLKRDDDFIFSMLSWIRRFYVTFVLGRRLLDDGTLAPGDDTRVGKRGAPPPDFFAGQEGYAAFVSSVRAQAAGAAVVAQLDNKDVQRSPLGTHFFN